LHAQYGGKEIQAAFGSIEGTEFWFLREIRKSGTLLRFRLRIWGRWNG
jgi:hypothetical protein